MRSEPVIVDPRHRRPLPSGQALARIMRQVLQQMRAEFLRNPRIYQPSYLSVTLFDLLLPIFERYAWIGAKQTQPALCHKSTWRLRKAIGGALLAQFNVLAPQILAAARRMTFAFLDGFFTSTSDMLRAALAASLAAGETALELQRRLVAIFGRERAAVIGQTECLPGDTRLLGGNVRCVYRRWYSGPMFKVITENGHQLTGTPNHPVLTKRGWVSLCRLTESDYLVSDGGDVQESVTSADKDVNDPPPTFDEVFHSFSAIGLRSWYRCGEPDFHGDGQYADVDILRADSELRYGRLATVNQLLQEYLFPIADQFPPLLICRGDVGPLGLMVGEANRFGMGSQRDSVLFEASGDSLALHTELAAELPEGRSAEILLDRFLLRELAALGMSVASRHFRFNGLAECPGCASTAAEELNHAHVTTHDFGDHPGTKTVPIKLDRVRLLSRIEGWRGHVYNLETSDGYYNANGLYTKNSSRATHEGQRIADKDSGVIEKRAWLASADACPLCLELDGKEVGMDEPFYVRPEGGPYAVILGPPAHPRCQCTTVGVF